MKKLGLILAVIVLIASLVLLFDKLFTPQPIQIVLQSGKEITTQGADYFTINEVLLLIVCAFFIGTAATYLFYNSDKGTIKEVLSPTETVQVSPPLLIDASSKEDHYEKILPLLKEDEKRAVILLREAGGEMLQNQLVLKLNESKVKVTRVIASLEEKNLIVKDRNGLTNCIKLK
ncbi:MAG: hypothetical protein WCV90_07665 [Candidatus Woesearchaeota archaeon]|jgi:uncharacterized membrane protein